MIILSLNERIENASPLELTVINYELVIANIDKAIKAAPKSAACVAALDKAREGIAALYMSLDMDIEFSQDLEGLYLFVNSVLIQAEFARSKEEKDKELAHARTICAELLSSWQALLDDPDLEKKLEAEAAGAQVYAGLTYGAGGQLTEFEDFDPDGGYKI